ncbi:MAG: hypothetical protein WC458_00100 [Patescibacteria group bacterium]
MDIVINTSGIEQFFNLPSEQMFWVFMGNFGWLAIAVVFLIGVREVYLLWIRIQWGKSHRNVLLAIDVPRGNEQSPKAVENMFTYLAGAHGSINFFEKWFEGQFQKSFSFEIVSLEGYTQFLIWTPVEFRNLVESAVYSQYPDAEISEVDDYTETVPQNVPDEEYDIWGTEFIQKDSSAYPIKCYQEFEHQMGPSETQFKDPMASLMDLCGSLRQGEQLWFQIIVIPTGFDWVKDSEKEINKIFGRKDKSKTGLALKGVEALGNASEILYPIWGDVESGDKKEERPKTMMDLTPGEKRKVEGIQIKASKLGFEAKIRAVYVAKREVMNKAKVANGLVGFMKQFASLDLNNLKPDMDMTMTKAQYFLRAPRLIEKKRKIFKAYISRSDSRGRRPGLFNIEELATIWHFPVEANVKAAMMQKAPGRKADAPASLPLAEEKASSLPDIFNENLTSTGAKSTGTVQAAYQTNSTLKDDLALKDAPPPPNLPTI